MLARRALPSIALILLLPLAAFSQDNRLTSRLTFKDVKMSALALDADSKFIVYGQSNGRLAIFEPKQGVQPVEFFPAHNGSTTCAAISPDKKWVASGGSDGSVDLWDTTVIAKFQSDNETRKEGVPRSLDPQPKKTFAAQNGGVLGMAFSPDNKRLATCGPDGIVKVWTVDTTKLTVSIQAHKGAAHAVAFSPDGTLLASGGADKIARIWKANKVVQTLTGHDGPVLSVDFAPNGKQLATASGAPKKGGQVRVWNVETGKEDYNLGKLDDVVTTLAFHPKLARLATGGKDKKVRVWNTDTKKQLYTDEHASELIRVQFSGDGGRLASICADEAKAWLGSPKVGE